MLNPRVGMDGDSAGWSIVFGWMCTLATIVFFGLLFIIPLVYSSVGILSKFLLALMITVLVPSLFFYLTLIFKGDSTVLTLMWFFEMILLLVITSQFIPSISLSKIILDRGLVIIFTISLLLFFYGLYDLKLISLPFLSHGLSGRNSQMTKNLHWNM